MLTPQHPFCRQHGQLMVPCVEEQMSIRSKLGWTFAAAALAVALISRGDHKPPTETPTAPHSSQEPSRPVTQWPAKPAIPPSSAKVLGRAQCAQSRRVRSWLSWGLEAAGTAYPSTPRLQQTKAHPQASVRSEDRRGSALARDGKLRLPVRSDAQRRALWRQ